MAFGLLFPSLVTWLYFVALTDQPAALRWAAYTVGKSIQFAFPLIWVLLVEQRRPALFPLRRTGQWENLAFGAAVMLGMVALYHFWLRPAGYLAPTSPTARAIFDKVHGFGVDGVWKYAALGAFYSVVHSGLEEYYWRWFVFGGLRRLLPWKIALVIGSLGFMLHHVILLAVYFGWQAPVTWVFSLGVAVGGAFWAWSYQRTGSLWGPWLSHLMVDAAIFLVGYDLVRHWL